MSKLDLKALDDEKLTDEELKRHRVGGRLVTRREIVRSRKCRDFGPFVNCFSNSIYYSHQSALQTYSIDWNMPKLPL